ncbi:MAG: cytochrome c3 family protein [Desulfuromonadales bacterium]|nr:cytochrome c3 family protein [Desulfuromonadales bacterium]
MNNHSKIILGRLANAAIILLLAAVTPVMAGGETVCIQCHGSQTGRGLVPVKPWQASIHAENGISCHNCHGGDPADSANAMSPQRGFLGAPREGAIPDFCGRCHIGIKTDYLRSAHGRALGKGGPTCVTCHDSHGVTKVSIELISEKNCTRCHSYERARIIRNAMEQTEANLVTLSRRIEQFKVSGVDTSALEKSLFSQRNSYHSLFHEVNPTRITAESAKIAAELTRIKGSLDAIDAEFHQRKLIGGIAVGAVLLLALLLNLLRKTYS